ncbi:MAG: methyltransferase domain-containing protein [Desulfovibrio sp.]|nr:methyltransferase domain-containing protein [Desulfovibrio sp.]
MEGRNSEIYEAVRKYYSAATKEKGGRLSSSVCCCSAEAVPKAVKVIISELPGEIVTKYYGCGSPIPDKVEGCTVLDLGCGTGRDVYVISKLVGALGTVIGLDMNEDQLEVAERYKAEMSSKWGFSNVVFKKGYMEDLAAVGIEDGSIDVVISNCVINLSPDKQSVFSEIHRVLKDGGVLFFSDVFADRKIPEEIRANPLLLGECLGGAMCPEEFDEVMKSSGLSNYEIISSVETPIGNKEIEALIGGVKYSSKTIRAVKGGESGCCRIATSYAEQSSCCCGATRLS